MTEPEEKPPHRDQASADTGNSRRVLGLSFEALSLIFDGIIAIAAIVGGIFVYRQLVATENQLKVMQDQTLMAKRAYQITNRPLLAARPLLTTGAGKLPQLSIELVNNGNAPAVNVEFVPGEVSVQAIYHDPDRPIFFRLPTIANGKITSIPFRLTLPPATHGREERDLPKFLGVVIDPNETSSISVPLDQFFKAVQPDWWDKVRRNPERLGVDFTGGAVRYEDLFGGVYTVAIAPNHPQSPGGAQNQKR